MQKKNEKARKAVIEAIIGRFNVQVEGVLADALNSRERLMDLRISEMMVVLNAHTSYRTTVDILNRQLIRPEEDCISYKTASDYLIRMGIIADETMKGMCNIELEKHGIDPETVLPKDPASLPADITGGNIYHMESVDPNLQHYIDRYNSLESHKNCPITQEMVDSELKKTEDPESTLYLSIDDTCTKSQKTTHKKHGKHTDKESDQESKEDESDAFLRSYPEYAEDGDNYVEANEAADLEEAAARVDKEDEAQENLEKEGDDQNSKKKSRKKTASKGKKNSKKTAKRVWHTNAQVIDGKTGRIYRFHARGKVEVIRQILAFCLKNRLLVRKNLVILTDGADDIRRLIAKYFSFREYRLIVDWYHVMKKCNEHASMALKCKLNEKRAIKRELFAQLWVGKVEDAINYLKSLDVKKDDERFDDFTGYLGRKQPYVPCYAVRKMLLLHNSSQFVEKLNDDIVSKRQKNNGMSWSWDGGCASATLRTIELNGELKSFLQYGSVKFEPVEPSMAKQHTMGKAA